MPRALRVLITVVISAAAAALIGTVLAIPLHTGFGASEALVFWTLLTLIASAFPVRLPGGTVVNGSVAPILAAAVLGGPTAAGVVAAFGTTDERELRGQVPWYGTLYNHASAVLPAMAAAVTYGAIAESEFQANLSSLLGVLVASGVNFGTNTVLTTSAIALRDRKAVFPSLVANLRLLTASLLGLGPLAWLMATSSILQWWAPALFALPLYTQRRSYALFAEIRDMFTQTVRSLSSAVDAKDKFTSGHSERVQLIAVDIGREMRCSEPELQNLEWGGLLHDIGKIGVPDAVLLKQGALTKEERTIMNMHPVKGEDILRPVAKLTEERRIIRHHHEWYNGSGYPDHLVGEEIPKLARILHVADAFEAMTAQRPYRMTPLTAQEAMAEIRKFTGIQFDPIVVDAFTRTKWVVDVPEQPQSAPLRPVPLLGQEAALRARATATEPSVTGPA